MTGTDKEKNSNNDAQSSKLETLETELAEVQSSLTNEKNAKQKIFLSLVKLAKELKHTKAESDVLHEAAAYANRAWYEGGIWRAPQLLPSALRDAATSSGGAGIGGSATQDQTIMREPVSLTDLFLDLVIVVAFSRVGNGIEMKGRIDGESIAFFAVFWLIWLKEASYSTRFDTSDLSSQMETLVTCFAVLFGSLSSSNMSFHSSDATRIMMVAAFVAVLHFLLHWRVASMYRFSEVDSEGYMAKRYASFIMAMTASEFCVWMVGIIVLPESSPFRWVVFLVGILFSLRVPKAFLANDFHAACSKRGVLFILLLGFTLQSVVLVASPFFDQMSPTTPQYVFFGCACLLLFCVKLLYVTDNYSVDPREHALLVNRFAGFFFHFGHFCLLFSTTIFGAGLDLITHSYLAAIAALPNNAKHLICGGFAAVITSIFFIKSMHIRRVPINSSHEIMFFVAYALQTIVHLAIITLVFWMCFARHDQLAFLMVNEIELLMVLSGSALLLVVISWLDEAIELGLYGESDARNFTIRPFGIWYCLQPQDDDHNNNPHHASFDAVPLLEGRSLSSAYRSLGLNSSLCLRSPLSSLEKLEEVEDDLEA